MKPGVLIRFMDIIGAPVLLVLGMVAIGAFIYLLLS